MGRRQSGLDLHLLHDRPESVVTPAAYARDVRLRRLFGHTSGKAVVVAWAHGPLLGPLEGLDRHAIETLGDSLAQADGLLVSPSMLPGIRDVLARRDRPTLFLLQHWQSVSRPDSLLGYEQGATAPLCTVEEAAQWGVDGVMTYLYVGWSDPEQEAREVARAAETSRACRELGLLHMIESRAVRDELAPDGFARPDLVRYHTRLAAELGADLVKTKWTGSATFGEVVAGCPVPVLIAGGARRRDFEEMLQEARSMVGTGASGLVWGRNLFQHSDPRAALEQLSDVVHGVVPAL
jgi:DhnA family fructose-bisphosphate aldolase class Ia